MYYDKGTYEAFAHPRKPEGVDNKSAYIIGSGLAGLSAAFYLVRDGQMKGEHIHILEKLPVTGGSCDGLQVMNKGFYMRGGREMDNHFECMWDMYKDIPSYEDPSMSVLDYYYYLNKKDPNYSLCRVTLNRGENANTQDKFTLDREASKELLKLYITQEKELEDKTIEDVLDEHFFKSNFWIYWQTMFAFQRTSSALEMKRYLCRYVHHIDGLPNFSALRFTKYNQYESMILPLQKWLQDRGVKIEFGMDCKNVLFNIDKDKKVAKAIVYEKDGVENKIDLLESDLVIITNGCPTDSSCYGDQNTAPDITGVVATKGESWDLWNNIKVQDQDGSFGNPTKFTSRPDLTNWMSATVETSDEEIIELIKKICKRDPRAGKVTTGGIVTIKDSRDNWYMSWTINRQPQFKAQKEGSVLIWLYSLNTVKPGNYVKKAMKDCTGAEVCEEWLYHIGAPITKIKEMAEKRCNTTTCYMPYINAFFMPRKHEDRPLVVPTGAVNFAFVGQFAETPRDTIFTTEYSIRTGMEAVYTLLDIDRAVPEVYGSQYDVREMLRATYYALDKVALEDSDCLNFVEKQAIKKLVKKFKGTDVELLLKDSHLIK